MIRATLNQILDEAGIKYTDEVSINITHKANNVSIVEHKDGKRDLIGWNEHKVAFHQMGKLNAI